MDRLEIARRRLRNQHLSDPTLTDPVAVVTHFGAVQAQEYGISKWSLGQRAVGVDDAAVQRAVDDGTILRTHALRPTWHYVAAADIRWIQAVTGPRVGRFNAYYNRSHGIDEDFGAKTTRVITEALRGGNHLTRKELGEALGRGGLPASGNQLAYVVMWAELRALIANGAMRGKQHTYALVEERAPDAVELDPDDALAELTRRYFTSHGPATVKDFAWWSSLTVATIKRGVALLGDELTSEVVEGRTYWFVPGPAPEPEPAGTVHLLQPYDEFIVAYTESRDVANIAGRVFDIENENTLVQAIVLDSQVVGVWRRLAARSGVVAEVRLAVKVTRAQRAAIEAAFARYSAFSKVPVTIDWAARAFM
jgi:hypothetical protein